MRKITALLLAGLLQTLLLPAETPDELPALHAQSAALVSSDGELLYALDADRMLPIASTTKLMTALVAAEQCAMDEPVEIRAEWCGVEGSSMYLRPEERYTVRELVTGLLLVSGNDAALALACHCAGDVAAFSALMNGKAAELGMRSSHFTNPHGLNEAGHYSTARDLAILMNAVMRDPALAAILAMKSASVGGQVIYNHNKLLSRCAGCIGGKTGYTEIAGRCLVSCVEREGTRFVCVTLSDPDDWNDHMRLYDWAFAHFEERAVSELVRALEVPVLSGKKKSVAVIPEQDRRFLLPKNCDLRIEAETPYYVFAPVAGGADAGRLVITADGETLAVIPLVFAEDIPVK